MRKQYQTVGEIFKALVDGKKICTGDTDDRHKFLTLNNLGQLVSDKGNIIQYVDFLLDGVWREYIEPVTLEMAISHYKATGMPFTRKECKEVIWGTKGGVVFDEEDITATDYVLLTE